MYQQESKDKEDEGYSFVKDNEEDVNFYKFRRSLDSMSNRRAKKYKNFENISPLNQKEVLEQTFSHEHSEEHIEKDACLVHSNQDEDDREDLKKTYTDYRVIHRPPLPPQPLSSGNKNQIRLYPKTNNQTKINFNYNERIEDILSDDTKIHEYLRELRKNSELDYLLLNQILERVLINKSNTSTQTYLNELESENVKSYQDASTNTVNVVLCQKQTQTRESRILSYKLLETENLFENFKVNNKNNGKSQVEVKNIPNFKNKDFVYETPLCANCNPTGDQNLKFVNINNKEKIQLWNNLLQINNTETEETDDQSKVNDYSKYKLQETNCKNYCLSTSDNESNYSNLVNSEESYSRNLDFLNSLNNKQRESEFIDKYNRVQKLKAKYKNEKNEFKLWKNNIIDLKCKTSNFDSKRKNDNLRTFHETQTIEFDEDNQPTSNKHNTCKNQKKISFHDEVNYSSKYNSESSQEESEQETTLNEENIKEDSICESQYSNAKQSNKDLDYTLKANLNKNLAESEHKKYVIPLGKQNVKKVQNKNESLSKSGGVKTKSKILIETTNLKKKEISEICSLTELNKEGSLSRKTKVTSIKKVPILLNNPNLNHLKYEFNTKTPEPIITSPPTTANTTLSESSQKKSKRKHKSNTIEIYSIPSSTNCSTRSTSVNEFKNNRSNSNTNLNMKASSLDFNENISGKYFGNAFSETELNLIKKEKNSILNEQLNFGLSEPSVAFNSTIYDEKSNKTNSKQYLNDNTTYCKNQMLNLPNKKKPVYLANSSNLQKIIEWQETNLSTITNEFDSEPLKDDEGNLHSAKLISLATETSFHNLGNNRIIETSSKATRKYDEKDLLKTKVLNQTKRNKEKFKNKSNSLISEQYKNNDLIETKDKSNSKHDLKHGLNMYLIKNNEHCENVNNSDEQSSTSSASANLNDIKNYSTSDQTNNENVICRCEKCLLEYKKKKTFNSWSRTNEKKNRIEEISFNDQNYIKEIKCSEDGLYDLNDESKDLLNQDLDTKLKKNDLNKNQFIFNLDRLSDNEYIYDLKELNKDSIENNYLYSKNNDESYLNSKLPEYSYISYENDKKSLNESLFEKENLNYDNLSKFSLDSGHSSDNSSTVYLIKPKLNECFDESSEINNLNSDLNYFDSKEERKLILCKTNDLNLIENEESENKYLSNENENKCLNKDENIFKKSNTEIVNRITKTIYPEDKYLSKSIRKKKFVFEQQVDSPSCSGLDPTECKITSFITVEIPCTLKKIKNRKKKSLVAVPNLDKLDTFFNDLNEVNLTQKELSSLSPSSSLSEINLLNEDEVSTITKLKKFKPVLVNCDSKQTIWEYYLECNCLNGINATVKTTITQIHQNQSVVLT